VRTLKSTVPVLNYSTCHRSQPSVVWFVRRFGGRTSQPSYSPWHLARQTFSDGLDVRGPHFCIVINLISLLIFSGNFLVISATCSITVALTFGGINFPWSSVHILAPLIIGLVGLIFFIIYDAIWTMYPLVGFAHASLVYLLQFDFHFCQVPFSILANRTSLSGQVPVLLKKSYIITQLADIFRILSRP
jgi:hypothetical protein